MTPNVPLLSWTPDGDLTRPGAIADVTNMVPTVRGYASHPSAEVTTSLGGTLPARCFGAGLVKLDGGSLFPFYGTATQLFVSSGSITDLTRVSPAYTTITSVSNGWRFAAYKSFSLACSQDNVLQVTATPGIGTKFTDVSGAPAAGTMCVQSGFVMLGKFNSGSWPYNDGWWCSALDDHTDWTPDLATQCDQGRLTQTPGGIVRMLAYQDDIIAFKQSSMYRGTYVNQPEAGIIWQWTVLSTSVGLAGHNAVCEAQGALYWAALDGIYRFDGARISRIASAPWEWMISQFRNGTSTAALIMATYDPAWRLVRMHFPDDLNEEPTVGVAYHLESDRWGKFEAGIEWAFSSAYDEVPGPLSSTTRLHYDVPQMVLSFTHEIAAWTGTPEASSITTGDIGDDERVTTLTKARLRAYRTPGSASATHYYRQTLDEALSTGATSNRADGKYDFSQAARWHRIKFDGTGYYDVSGFSVLPPPSGSR